MIYRLAVPGPIEDVEEVRVLEWHVQPGAAVEPGALLVELETHKALVEVRAGQSGVLRAILCPAGEWQALGQPIALLSDTPDEPLPATAEDLADWPVDFEVS
ncbi:MAG TPA: lipoyl domain-containing protein [Caulobacteraceae bacterium]|nr:lipoyl domain-containing protein [Caulobacteraceae bacterium]